MAACWFILSVPFFHNAQQLTQICPSASAPQLLKFSRKFPTKMASPYGDHLASFSATTKSCNSNKSAERLKGGWNNSCNDGDLELMARLSSCCCGKLDSKSSLQLLAFLNFVLDTLCTYLSLEHMFVPYLFAGCAILSLLSLCAVINGVQEEKKAMIKMTAMYAGIKAVVLGALAVTAVAAFIEEQQTNLHFRPSFEVKALLFCVLPLFVLSLSAQYTLSQRVVSLIRLKDQLYVISTPIRPSIIVEAVDCVKVF